MRNSFLFALAFSALTLCACDNIFHPVPGPKPVDNEITFCASDLKAYTKSVIEGTVFPTDQSFLVYGKKYTGDYTAWGDGEDYMYSPVAVGKGVQTSYVSGTTMETSGWHTDQKFYWPQDNSKLAFLACSPVELSGYDFESSDYDPANIIFDIDGLFIDHALVLGDEDILYCDPVIDQVPLFFQNSSSPRPVQIQFKHALSAIGFEVSLDENSSGRVSLNKLSLERYPCVGDFSQNLSQNANGPVWNCLYGANSATFLGGIMYFVDGENLELTSNPQSITLKSLTPHNSKSFNSYIKIEYTVIPEGADSGTVVEKTIRLADIMGEEEEFVMGKKYIISLVFNPSDSPEQQEISFAPTVTDWETVEKSIVIQ